MGHGPRYERRPVREIRRAALEHAMAEAPDAEIHGRRADNPLCKPASRLAGDFFRSAPASERFGR